MSRAPRPDPTPRTARWGIVVLGLLAGAATMAACSSEAKDATIRQLAVGTWTCASDSKSHGDLPFDITIHRKGTFSLGFTEDPMPTKITGTWSLHDGDLDAAFNDAVLDANFKVNGFDALTTDSRSFTLHSAVGMAYETKAPSNEQEKVLTEVHGTDSVTFDTHGGHPWTCDRK